MAESHPLALPPTLSPDSLDVLTHLSTILSEVRTTLQASTGLEADNEKKNMAAGGAGGATGPGGSSTSAAGGLTFKDVARASDGVKHKLQRARDQVRALPDMSRGIEEQEAEMRELEARIERQRALLQRLRDESVSLAKDEDGTTADKMDI